MKQKIKNEAEHEEHKTSDSFIFTILSHGNKGIIYARDGARGTPRVAATANQPEIPEKPPTGCLDIEKDILQQFDGAKSPNLFTKPKIFFIQACQGRKYNLYL